MATTRNRRKAKEDKMSAIDAEALEATDTQVDPDAPVDPDAKAEPRPETTFRIFVRAHGEELWRCLDETIDGRTQDEGKKRAARMLGEQESYKTLIEGDGLELAVTSARSFKPQLVKVEPQPSKVVIR